MHKDIIEVPQFKKEKACKGDVLTSGGMGPCISIVIYNPKSKCAFMMHEPSWIMDGKLEKKLKDIIKQLGGAENLKAYAAGNSISSDEEEEQQNDTKENRGYVKEQFLKFFKEEDIWTQWSNDDSISEMTFYTATGECKFTQEKLSERGDNDDYNDSENYSY
jgi:hypothetical protein